MKTLDEVIALMEDPRRCDVPHYKDDVLYHLKEYQRYQKTPSCMCHMAMCDENNPLTWDDLCKLDMIGSPVWNGSTCRWMLLIDSANDGTWIEMINHAGGHEKWIEHDLRKNPLYRKER